MYSAYVIYSSIYKRTYTGLTNNLERRLKEHNNKKNKSTKAYAPWKLIYQEEFATRIEARKKEKYLKSGNGREYLKTIILAS
ncbi:MAG: GIY-YIG nuclease family protein [Flavobacteriaceae bacterium]|nr:GIY-YIG nuclease family protein [Flavobacteriaceae bacterium]